MYWGIGVSGGYGIGRAVLITDARSEQKTRSVTTPAGERARLGEAIERFCEQNRVLAERVGASVGEAEAQIIAGHTAMVQDPVMRSETEKNIDAGMCAEEAFRQVCDGYIALFSGAEDEYTRQRAADVRDVQGAVLGLLNGEAGVPTGEFAPGTVLVARELTPSMTAGLDRENIVGLVTETGSRTSHAAILARAMEIPAVLGVPGITEKVRCGDSVIVDGERGEVLVSPTEEQMAAYTEKRQEHRSHRRQLRQFIGRPTRTADGVTVQLFGNIGTPEDAERVREEDGEGIGLFRTEFLFMEREAAPTEEEQFLAYRKVLATMRDKRVILRTLDIGGDKPVPYLGIEREENPFLGCRGVRYCLRHPEVFETQLRAAMRAAVYGNLALLIPMVTGVDEIRQVREAQRRAARELEHRGVPYNGSLPLGVMIETPAAALCADLLAKEADFFSIGTNDLTGYTLAVDRGNLRVADLYSAFSPAVLRALRDSIAAAHRANIPVGMCGEAAADPLLTPLLLAFGLDEFSVSASSLLATRREIARWTVGAAKRLAEQVLALDTTRRVQTALENARPASDGAPEA